MTQEEFRQQFTPLGPGLFRIAYRFLGDEAEAKDAVQDLLVKLWNSRHTLGGVSNIKAYSYTLMKNLCIDRIRRKSRMVSGELPERGGPPPEEGLQARETLRQTLVLIGQLPPRQRDILKMRVFEGLEYEEIARKMGMTEINTRVQLSLARKTLKQKIDRL